MIAVQAKEEIPNLPRTIKRTYYILLEKIILVISNDKVGVFTLSSKKYIFEKLYAS